MKEETRKLANRRLVKAGNTFQEGITLLEKGFFSGAVNRFYYAAFYAAKALLATKELDSSKHKGVIALFHEHFVRTGLVDKEKARALSESFEQRQDSDYEDFVDVTAEDAQLLKQEVKEFIDERERLLNRLAQEK